MKRAPIGGLGADAPAVAEATVTRDANSSALDQVLACRSLPTLPAVAVELLELMRDDSATLKQIAKLVRSDQGLATKVLRTVNSPLYGLRSPCRSIDRALALLGLSAVKSIALGFSLMESAPDAALGGFDVDTYWKRVIYSAAAARQAALMTGSCDPDEAFTGGLFQDMGMLAMAVALGERYCAVLRGVRHCHLPRAELEALGLDHPRAGAALAQRWRLPEPTIECVRWHHDPPSAPATCRSMVSCVALGSLIACELLAPASERRLASLARASNAWFAPGSLDLAELLRASAEDAAQMAVLFEKRIGAPVDLEALLAEAHEQLVQHQVNVAQEAQTLLAEAMTDALTGARNRRSFDQSLEAQFREVMETGEPLAVLFIDVDHFKPINDRHGHAVGDAVLVELASRMTAALGSRGTLFRYGGEEFAALAGGLDAQGAQQAAEALRQAVAGSPVDLRHLNAGPDEAPVTVSVGVAMHDPAAPFADAAAFVRAADEALYAAKRAGRNRVAGAPAPARPASAAAAPAPAPGAEPLRVLLIEDDSLAAAVIRARLARRPEVVLHWERTRAGAEAHLHACEQGARPAPDIILCDLFLDGDQMGTDVIRSVRSLRRLGRTPVWAISASDADADQQACLAAGATAFRSKQTIVGSLAEWVDEVVASARAA
jgi:two-component system, cell cycle response regulator